MVRGRQSVLILLFTASVFVGFLLPAAVLHGRGTGDVRVAVVVLDGADWTPVNQLRKQGRLPMISSYMENGVYGNLSNTEALSPIIWTKIATGRSSDAVQIEDWNTVGDHGPRMVRREDVRHKRIWDYLNDAGYRTGVVGWLLTWPVENVTGFMVSGPIRTSNEASYHPEAAFNETERAIIRNGSEWQEAAMGVRRKDTVDFLALGMKNLDLIQHHLWKFVEPEPFGMEWTPEHDRYREFVYTEYENLDRVLSRFDEDWNVIVFGDSGYRPESEVRGWVGPSYALGINPLIEALGYGEFHQETVRGTAMWRHTQDTRLKSCPLLLPMVDVVGPTTIRFRICVLDEDVDVERVIANFTAISYQEGLPVSGEPLIDRIVYRKEEHDLIGYMNVYPEGIVAKKVRIGSTVQPLVDGPVPFIDPALGITLPNGTDTNLWIGPEKSGDHPPGTSSIFLASGPAFREGVRLRQGMVSTVDVAPTVLYMYGLPVPEGMDGRVVTELFTDTFNADRTIRYTNQSTWKQPQQPVVASEEGWEEALKQQLRDIGYIVS